MNQRDFLATMSEVFLLDGATGTLLQSLGMPLGVCPEKWITEQEDAFIAIQRHYIEAGSQGVLTPTFGANRLKLKAFHLDGEVYALNKRLAEISRAAVGDKIVIGDLSSTGIFFAPLGELSFEEGVEIYKEQVQGLLAGGVDLFFIETIMDLQEARAALLAVKECSDLPCMVSMTYEQNGRTLTGVDPLCALLTLESLGAAAVGCNCSGGPEEMLPLIKKMAAFAKVPLLAKPNAGLPQLVEGKTRFSLNEEVFAESTLLLRDAGARILGGCCGTNPHYIGALKRKLAKRPLTERKKARETLLPGVCSSQKRVMLDQPLRIIGERINPTGKKKLILELQEEKITSVLQLAKEQMQQGADLLDVNLGAGGVDEYLLMAPVVKELSLLPIPLCFDTTNVAVMERALRMYPGRALMNSISDKGDMTDKLLGLAAKYGAMFILLPLTEGALPVTVEERIQITLRILKRAQAFGLGKESVIVDGLALTAAANPESVPTTLEFIRWCTKELGVPTTIGLSNISFGLPNREALNATFLSMALGNGLTTAIANPGNKLIQSTKEAYSLLYNKGSEKKEAEKRTDSPLREQIHSAIVFGEEEVVFELLRRAKEEGISAQSLLQEVLIPAISAVGDRYEKGEFFLPQLIKGAQVMEAACAYLKPSLSHAKETTENRVLLATVKGDVHDIGKNLVALMLRNAGFTVYDLGKNVPTEDILRTIKEEDIRLVGLSALMTTTMLEMPRIIQEIKKQGLPCKVMVGGACVTEDYARTIKAQGYAAHAQGAVRLAKILLTEERSGTVVC